MWPVDECPSFENEGFSFWSYFFTLLIGGPLTALVQGLIISCLSGEWAKQGPKTQSFRREMLITSYVLFFTAPFLAISYKMTLEGKIGKIYHSGNGLGSMLPEGMNSPLLTSVIEIVLFNVLADAWFYWIHRLFHEVHPLYRLSHYLHHSAHPVNTFIGNGGDVLELMIQGELQVFVPPLFLPVFGRTFVINAILIQGYVLFLHGNHRVKFPDWLRKYIVDPYEHNIHHHYGFRNYNFGLYITFWDRLMGTHKSVLPQWEKKRTENEQLSPGIKETQRMKKVVEGLPFRALAWRTLKQVLMVE